jgi:ABC-type transport system substrate-binding protein
VAAVRDGTVDIAQTADTSNLVDAKKDKTLLVQATTGTSSTILVLNPTKPPFNDIRMREAINYGIDRDELNTSYYGGARVPAYGPLPASDPYYDPMGQLPHHDAAKAKALVKQLVAEGKATSYTSLCINTPEAAASFAILGAQGRRIGLNGTQISVDQATLVTRLLARKGDFEIACFRNPQITDPDGLYATYYRTGGNNISLYTNYTVDEALRAGRKTTDQAARRRAYDIVQEQLAKDVVVVPLLFDLYGNIHSKSVSGLSTPQPDSLGLIDPGDLYRIKQ